MQCNYASVKTLCENNSEK